MSASARSGDVATVSVTVGVGQTLAFDVFTREIDLWWRRGVRFRFGRRVGALCLESGVGGRLFESFDSESGPHVIEVGRVTHWDPPAALAFTWRNVNFAEDEITQVEITFESLSETSTRVTVRHRGWAMLRPDHPARHGLAPGEFIRVTGLWWGDLMTALREYIDRARNP
ncbi:MAG TPA: SRPBCC domain-containing protein [Steroidobacteraceae bacterium]|nr:SRPBCC domain-containing protein [Steroidobacteraceae bacterium]